VVPLDELMTRQEVADLLRVSTRTVDRLGRDDFEFPSPIRIGQRRIVYRRLEVEAYHRARGMTTRAAARQRATGATAQHRSTFGYLVTLGVGR
jgi:predicted DNA-binding transcriptional regulator AlpA